MLSEMPKPPDPFAVETGRASNSRRVYLDLRNDLLHGRLPLGTRLIEEQLAERFGVSRTPVREALHRLEADGHVVRDSSGGLAPNPPRPAQMRQLYEVRVEIEQLLTRRAATVGDTARLVALRDGWRDFRARWFSSHESIEGPDFVYADEGFHEVLGHASGNLAALRYLRDINERIRALRMHDFTTTDRVEQTIVEHLEIIDAVCAGEPEVAAALMREHVERSAKVVEERVGAVLARMFDAAEAGGGA